MNAPSPISRKDAGATWPVVVIGAGLAGTTAARGWAAAGVPTLLVDRAAFPRPKVCGGCLNAAALAALADLGLSHLLDELAAPILRQVEILHRTRSAILPLPAGRAVSRGTFDAALLEAAVSAGATFLPRTAARILPPVDPTRPVEVRLQSAEPGAAAVTVTAGLVIVADGLAGGSLRDVPEFRVSIHPGARLGAGAIFRSPGCDVPPGTIRMACGRSGYVGIAAVDGGLLDVAAAFDGPFVKQAGGPAAAATAILREAGSAVPVGLASAEWSGTPALTRVRRPFAAGRIFTLGDAAGYVEPFTGEGMAWALEASCRLARHLAPFAPRLLASDDLLGRDLARAAERWDTLWNGIRRSRRTLCGLLTETLRRPRLWSCLFALLRTCPGWAGPVVRLLNRPPTFPPRPQFLPPSPGAPPR